MTKLKVSHKTYRSFEFIVGLRHPGVVTALVPYGYSPEVAAEGVELLKRVTLLSHDSFDLPDTSTNLWKRLDHFESLWFRVSRSSLARRFPVIAAHFFANLAQADGKRTTFGLITFLDRLRALAAGEAPFGAEGPQARALLRERGLTDEVEQEGQALIDQLTTAAININSDHRTELEAAEAVLWNWYTDWSGIARAVIKSKGQLRALGFRKARPSSEEEEVLVIEPGDPLPALPAKEPQAAE